MNLKAKVTYRNKQLEPVSECVYPFEDYANILSMDLKRIITDVEDVIYALNGNLPKEEWSEAGLAGFSKIRSKILDKAGEIARLPENVFDADEQKGCVAGFWDRFR